MKTKFTALKSLVIISAFLLPLNLMAQDDVGGLFKATPADATKLVNAYMRPLFKGLGVGLNSGWNNTAKAKNFLRFELRITGSLAFVPSEDQSYNSNSLGLQNIRPVSGQSGIGPTAFGAKTEGSTMELHSNGTAVPGQTFNLPKGTGIHFVPSPQVQLTVGLPKNIDVSLRYVPSIKLGKDGGDIQMYGVGAKVELLPLIMGKKEKLLPFDLAIAAAITRLNYNLPLDINNNPNSDQEIDIKINGFSAEAIISKRIAILTPFASVGFNKSTSSLKANGTYSFDVPITPSTPTGKQTYTNPIDISSKDISGLRASVGFQLNLAFFRLYSSYTVADYSYFNAGIGFGIGK
jgi:hypothetical protein